MKRVLLSLTLVLATATAASAQAPQQAGKKPDIPDDWKIAVYPVFGWLPLGIKIGVTLPPDGGGGGGGDSAETLTGRFDGALLAGVSLSKSAWRVDIDGLWAAVGGDRPPTPKLTVDVDVIYFHVTGGYRIYKDVYLEGGVRRFALNYDITLGDRPGFSRKPGMWNPTVGAGFHHYGKKTEFHADAAVGGFGVGVDLEASAGARMDWKPATHF
jgi:hypothetical protein